MYVNLNLKRLSLHPMEFTFQRTVQVPPIVPFKNLTNVTIIAQTKNLIESLDEILVCSTWSVSNQKCIIHNGSNIYFLYSLYIHVQSHRRSIKRISGVHHPKSRNSRSVTESELGSNDLGVRGRFCLHIVDPWLIYRLFYSQAVLSSSYRSHRFRDLDLGIRIPTTIFWSIRNTWAAVNTFLGNIPES